MEIDVGKNDIAAIKHGWCCNSEGVPLIWMPLLQWLLNGEQNYNPAAALWKQWETFAYALRKVSEYRRLCIEGATKEDAEFNDGIEAHLLLPGITEYALGLCKRIVSSTIAALIFRGAIKNSGSISDNTRKFMDHIENVELNMGDTKQFAVAWRSINDWYWEIADPNNVRNDSEKGIRDLLEHRNVIMQVNLGATDNSWYCDLSIHGKDGEFLKNMVLEYLKMAVHGLCVLYDQIHDSLHVDVNSCESKINWILPYGQQFIVVGKFDDYIAFWPSFGKNNVITTEKSRIQFARQPAQPG